MAGDDVISIDNHINAKSNPRRTYEVVMIATRKMGISKDGNLPWKLPSDRKFFHDITSTTSDPTKKNAVIMGRKTWFSTLDHPLPGRLNIILTRSKSISIATSDNVVISGSFASALELMDTSPYCMSIEKVFLIGGGDILSETLNAPRCVAIHLTEIETEIECDTFMPSVDTSVFQLWYSSFPLVENNVRYSFNTYVRVKDSPSQTNNILSELNANNFSFLSEAIFEKHEEFLYLGLVNDIITNGNTKDDRKGTGTLSKFGCQMRFNLRKSFPLLTTKKVSWQGVVEELLWFISGSTNAKVLQEKGIHIWDETASRDYLDSSGLVDREEGDFGPVCGFQWRHFGARYRNMHTDYTGQGFDQLLDVIDKIKNKPDDRRIILSAWNPSDLKLMALPPCHMFAQFYVANGELSCQIYQRSADMGLEVPFSIASYALLTCILAHVCDILPGDFIHVIGDAHVYCTQIQQLQDQIQKQPRPFPILKINPQKRDIDSFEAADFILNGYDPNQKVGMNTVV